MLWCGCLGWEEFGLLLFVMVFSYFLGYAMGWIDSKKKKETQIIKNDITELKYLLAEKLEKKKRNTTRFKQKK